MIRYHVIIDVYGEEITLLITEAKDEAEAMERLAGRANRPYIWVEDEAERERALACCK